MYVINRKPGEKIKIGDVTIINGSTRRVRFLIDAPKDVKIERVKEEKDVISTGTTGSVQPSS